MTAVRARAAPSPGQPAARPAAQNRTTDGYIEGRRLVFTGSAWGLFGLWWKWLILIIITLGIYGFWVGPRLYRWRWEHTSWAQQVPGGYAVAPR